jgi:exodeoxyribonuclease VII small subunit
MSEVHGDLSFEEAVTRLEDIVTDLEAGSLPLDECLRRFEQAVCLSRHCAAQLQAAEQQMSVLIAEELQPVTDLARLTKDPLFNPPGG